VLGREVATLVNGFKEPGSYRVSFTIDASTISIPSGIYFYRLTVGTFSETRRMVVLK
jgi:hypothetical protein